MGLFRFFIFHDLPGSVGVAAPIPSARPHHTRVDAGPHPGADAGAMGGNGGGDGSDGGDALPPSPAEQPSRCVSTWTAGAVAAASGSAPPFSHLSCSTRRLVFQKG